MGRNGMTLHYGDSMFMNNQNKKMIGSDIFNIDTIRGCPFNCESCYAKKGTCRTITHFNKPMLITNFTGRPHDHRQYRVGNQGDPCINWTHSEELVRHYKIPNVFAVTKLLSLNGFTGFFQRLQVSVDPMKERHFLRTLANVSTLFKDCPDVQIVLRVRSLSTTDISILRLMNEAVAFANMHSLPIMDTRMRFLKKEALAKYSLVIQDYQWKNTAYRPIDGKIFLIGVKKYYDCDLYGDKCQNCNHCEITWDMTQRKRSGIFIANPPAVPIGSRKCA